MKRQRSAAHSSLYGACVNSAPLAAKQHDSTINHSYPVQQKSLHYTLQHSYNYDHPNFLHSYTHCYRFNMVYDPGS